MVVVYRMLKKMGPRLHELATAGERQPGCEFTQHRVHLLNHPCNVHEQLINTKATQRSRNAVMNQNRSKKGRRHWRECTHREGEGGKCQRKSLPHSTHSLWAPPFLAAHCDTKLVVPRRPQVINEGKFLPPTWAGMKSAALGCCRYWLRRENLSSTMRPAHLLHIWNQLLMGQTGPDMLS